MNASFASPLADAKYPQFVGHPQIDSILTQLSEISGWTIAVTLLLVAVAYDQCELRDRHICEHANFADPSFQLAIFGGKVQLLAQHGRPPSSDPFSRRWNQSGPSIWRSGQVVL